MQTISPLFFLCVSMKFKNEHVQQKSHGRHTYFKVLTQSCHQKCYLLDKCIFYHQRCQGCNRQEGLLFIPIFPRSDIVL